MNDEQKMYGVMLEWKNEQPLMMESKPMTYEEAHNRMKEALTDSRVIRVCMFKATCVEGNETLLPQENL